MGFYLRKSVRVGPLRFNLSKSGIGVSAGVRGLRVGTGPRGNYVHMGRGGVYYRSTLSPAGAPYARAPQLVPLDATAPVEIESGSAASMRDSSSAALLDEIAAKKALFRVAPFVLVAGVVTAAFIFILGQASLPPAVKLWSAGAVLGIAAVGSIIAHRWDVMRKTVVLLYDLDPDTEARYQALHDGFDRLQSCARVWHVATTAAIRDTKRHGGATSAQGLKVTRPAKRLPPFMQSNLEVPALPVGQQTLYFFPDRVLVFDSHGVGAVAYGELVVERSQVNFVEEGTLPTDATVIGKTWKYVSKKGGPDRRFKDNREIPLARYEQVQLRSGSGLNELVQLSKVDGGAAFAEALGKMKAPVK